MKKFRIKLNIDTDVEAESMEEALDEFYGSFDLWGEIDIEEIEG